MNSYRRHMTDRPQDVAAIRQVIADHEQGFNDNDPDLYTAHYRQRCWVVDVTGTETEGRAALLERARIGLSGPWATQYARYTPGDVEFLGPDVAIIHLYAAATTPTGEPTAVGHTMIALYVLARTDTTWQVIARHDTLARTPTTP
jgi:uncharacterized protein (TIGR02246 family)